MAFVSPLTQSLSARWVRGGENIGFNRPHTYFCIGVRGSGKSRLLEHIGEGFLSEGNVVLDLFGSHDGEGFAWLRNPYARDKRILLVHGDNVSVQSSFECKSISKISRSDFQNHDIIVSSSPLHSDTHDEFIVRMAKSSEEAAKLIEVGFQLADTIDGIHLYRKRK